MCANLRACAIAVAAAIGCGAASPLAAQSGDAVRLATNAAERQEEEDRSIVEEQGPADREGFSPSRPTIQLLAEKGESEVSLGITLDRSKVHVSPTDRLRQRAQTTRFSLHGFAPVDKDNGERFVNLAKPISGSRLKLGLVHYFSNYRLRQEDIDVAIRVMNLSFTNCVRERVRAWAADKPEASRQLAADYNDVIAALRERKGLETEAAMAAVASQAFDNLTTIPEVAALRDDPAFQRLAEAKKLPAFAQLEAVTNGCRVGTEGGFKNNELLIQRYGDGSPIASSIRGVTGRAPTFFVGGDATFGRKSFSFLDRTTFAMQDDDKGEYELAAFAGVIAGNGLWSLRGGVSHSKSYEAQDEVELCQPTSTAGQTQCLSGADGPPARVKRTVLTLEGRRLFQWPGTTSHVGIAPEVALDPHDGEYSIDVPVYFAPDKDGHLTGGIRVGYASEKNDLSFGLFIGAAFSVFQ